MTEQRGANNHSHIIANSRIIINSFQPHSQQKYISISFIINIFLTKRLQLKKKQLPKNNRTKCSPSLRCAQYVPRSNSPKTQRKRTHPSIPHFDDEFVQSYKGSSISFVTLWHILCHLDALHPFSPVYFFEKQIFKENPQEYWLYNIYNFGCILLF